MVSFKLPWSLRYVEPGVLFLPWTNWHWLWRRYRAFMSMDRGVRVLTKTYYIHSRSQEKGRKKDLARPTRKDFEVPRTPLHFLDLGSLCVSCTFTWTPFALFLLWFCQLGWNLFLTYSILIFPFQSILQGCLLDSHLCVWEILNYSSALCVP